MDGQNPAAPILGLYLPSQPDLIVDYGVLNDIGYAQANFIPSCILKMVVAPWRARSRPKLASLHASGYDFVAGVSHICAIRNRSPRNTSGNGHSTQGNLDVADNTPYDH